MSELNGGIIHALGLLLTACAFAYNYGKDAGARDARINAARNKVRPQMT